MNRNPPPAPADVVAIAVTLVLVLALIVLPAALVVFLLRRRRSRRENGAARGLALPERASASRAARGWPFGLLLVGFLFGFWFYAPKAPRARPPVPAPAPAPRNAFWPTLLPVSLGALLVAYVIAQVVRSYDPIANRAMRMNAAGDTEGALALLAGALDVKPTAARANNLACILIQRQDWQGAYKNLLLARELASSKVDKIASRNNTAVVLREMGRPADAVAELEPRVLGVGATLLEVCTYTNALIDLGRLDEALAQIRRAEELYAKGPSPGRGQQPLLREAIDRCRGRFEEQAGLKKGPGPGDEI